MWPSPFSVNPLCMHLPTVRTSGTHIHKRTLKTGTYSYQADGRHRQKDTGSLTSTWDWILYLLEALLNGLSRAAALTQSWQGVSRQSVPHQPWTVWILVLVNPKRTPSDRERRKFWIEVWSLIAFGVWGVNFCLFAEKFGEGICDLLQ